MLQLQANLCDNSAEFALDRWDMAAVDQLFSQSASYIYGVFQQTLAEQIPAYQKNSC